MQSRIDVQFNEGGILKGTKDKTYDGSQKGGNWAERDVVKTGNRVVRTEMESYGRNTACR